MKKTVIVNKFRFTLFITVCVLVMSLFFGTIIGSFDARGAQEEHFVSVNVKANDTLWNLAKTYGPQNADIRETVYRICKVNDVSASTIVPGQQLLIPVD